MKKLITKNQKGGIPWDIENTDYNIRTPRSLVDIKEAGRPMEYPIPFEVKSPMLGYSLEKQMAEDASQEAGKKRTLKIKDPTQTGSYNVNPLTVKRYTQAFSNEGLNPNTVVAMMLQEGYNRDVNPLGSNLPIDYQKMESKGDWGLAGERLRSSVQLFKDKLAYAKKLGKTGEANEIQAWNGFGTLEGGPFKFYGRTGKIDMGKDPVYGKEVLRKRSFVEGSPEVQSIIKNIPKHQTGSVIVNRGVSKYNSPEETESRKMREANERAEKISGRLDKPPVDAEDFLTLGATLGIKTLGKVAGSKIGKTIGEDAFNIFKKSPSKNVENTSFKTQLRRELIQPTDINEANTRIRKEMFLKRKVDPHVKEYIRDKTWVERLTPGSSDKKLKELTRVPNPKIIHTEEGPSAQKGSLGWTGFHRPINISPNNIEYHIEESLLGRPLPEVQSLRNELQQGIASHELHHSLHPPISKEAGASLIRKYPNKYDFSRESYDYLTKDREVLARVSQLKNRFGFKVRPNGKILDNAGYDRLTSDHFKFVDKNIDLFDPTDASNFIETITLNDLSKINKYATGVVGGALGINTIKNKE